MLQKYVFTIVRDIVLHVQQISINQTKIFVHVNLFFIVTSIQRDIKTPNTSL